MMPSMWQSGKKNQVIKRDFPKSHPILKKLHETTLHLQGNGDKRHVVTPIMSQLKVDADLLSDLTALKTVLEQESKILTLHTIFGDYGGSVRWIMKFILVNDSLLDIGSRFNVHKAALDVISAMSLFPDSSQFLGNSEGEESSISDLLENLAQQCAQFLALCLNQKIDVGESMSAAHMFSQAVMEVHKLMEAQKNESTLSVKETVSADEIQSLLAPLSISSSLFPEQQYLAALRPLKFEAIALCDLITSGTTHHHFLGLNSAQYLQNSSGHGGVEGDACKRLVRVACEMSGVSASLPVEFGSSIFVRCDETRMDILKALIIGPEDTPYANGCFEFDILLPPAYPTVPPKVHLVTTGGGTVRFNPNLYDCGKVCLSLLGTWSGPGWDAAQSTLLQVLVSIQSLILVPDPYFNEPGYEHHRNAPSCITESKKYDQNIRTQTLRFSILGALQSPSPVFREVITQHFYHKREAVRQQLTEWARISSDAQQPAVIQLTSEIKAALDRVDSDMHSSVAVDRAGEKARCSGDEGFGEMKSGGGPKG